MKAAWLSPTQTLDTLDVLDGLRAAYGRRDANQPLVSTAPPATRRRGTHRQLVAGVERLAKQLASVGAQLVRPIAALIRPTDLLAAGGTAVGQLENQLFIDLRGAAIGVTSRVTRPFSRCSRSCSRFRPADP